MNRLLTSDQQRQAAEAISQLVYCNPVLGRLVELERQVLQQEFTPFFAVWHPRADMEDDNPNIVRIAAVAEELAATMRGRLLEVIKPREDERQLYEDLCFYVLYYRHHPQLWKMTQHPQDFRGGTHVPFWSDFRRDFQELLGIRPFRLADHLTPAHVLACLFQIRRAFHFTFRSIGGGSLPTAKLRAQVWQSIFTHDLRRYQRLLYDRMGEITTLITGPSGAGKELVARAIGWSRYIPFDPKTSSFRESFEESFFPLHLASLSPTLIESELFGHQRGAFTGAVSSRKGWLEVCPPLGAVFLDEIGEVEPGIQVKLLRVLETRRFQPLGTSEERTFHGKVIAATNRNLAAEMQQQRFRQDLYYRLCADIVVAPSLQERIADSPEELSTVLSFLACRLLGADEEAWELAREAEAWIADNLGRDYPWPGNVRELSQCLSNYLIRRDYRPAASSPAGWRERWTDETLEGRLSAEEMLRHYCTLVYARTGSYVDTARRLDLDRRTVKAKIDEKLLAEMRGIIRVP
jgi:hypothetical protein